MLTEPNQNQQLKLTVRTVSPEQRIRWFDQYSSDLTAFVEHAGWSNEDARATLDVVRTSLQSTADNLEDFLQDVKAALLRQLEANRFFTKIYLEKQRFVHSVVRRLVGRQDYTVDIEGLTSDVFVAVLRKLTVGAFTYAGEPQLNSWLKQTARGVVSDFQKKHARRLKRVQGAKPDMLDEMPNGYAKEREDKRDIGEKVSWREEDDEVE